MISKVFSPEWSTARVGPGRRVKTLTVGGRRNKDGDDKRILLDGKILSSKFVIKANGQLDKLEFVVFSEYCTNAYQKKYAAAWQLHPNTLHVLKCGHQR